MKLCGKNWEISFNSTATGSSLARLIAVLIEGALTVDAMEALFQPVPFGEVRESVLEKISTPDNAPIWDMFRSIDPDKQQKVLLVSPYPRLRSYLLHAD